MGKLDREADERIRQLATQLWQSEDCPEGRAQDYPLRAARIMGILDTCRLPEIHASEAERDQPTSEFSVAAAMHSFSLTR